MLKDFPEDAHRLHGADGIEVVAEVDEHGVEKLYALAAGEPDVGEKPDVAGHQVAEDGGTLARHDARMGGLHGRCLLYTSDAADDDAVV